jgi:hypothetical protein
VSNSSGQDRRPQGPVHQQPGRRKNDKQARLQQADVPLWPGSNNIVVVTRESTDVRAVEQFVVYRDK